MQYINVYDNMIVMNKYKFYQQSVFIAMSNFRESRKIMLNKIYNRFTIIENIIYILYN